jgi:hypothetical protein
MCDPLSRVRERVGVRAGRSDRHRRWNLIRRALTPALSHKWEREQNQGHPPKFTVPECGESAVTAPRRTCIVP